ncbi:hypothetical protein C8R45DRAFT_1108326 [Mycena sanguinolenta]|nr:hypothetical protein C8R45DRAFT_1108326 [Mycena sanguinolenta]
MPPYREGSGAWRMGVTRATAWIWSTAIASTSAAAGTVAFRKTVVSLAVNTATKTIPEDLKNWQIRRSSAFRKEDCGRDRQLGVRAAAHRPAYVDKWLHAAHYDFRCAGGGRRASSTGLVGALQIVSSDGSSGIMRTDTTWVAGSSTSSLSTSFFQLSPQGCSGLCLGANSSRGRMN